MNFHKTATIYDIETPDSVAIAAHKRNPKHLGKDPLLEGVKAIDGVSDVSHGSACATA